MGMAAAITLCSLLTMSTNQPSFFVAAEPTARSTLTEPATDLFLLSGQSNMEGHTTSKKSIGRNGDYWNELKSILEQGGNLNTMKQKLYNVIYEENYKYRGNHQVATTLTNGVMNLYKSALLDDLDTPLQFGKCSFKRVTNDTYADDASQGTVPTVWNANCGSSFGHELMFSRTMELTMNYATDFEMHKVARGGSGLYEHWYPNHGRHWNLLKDAIEERQGQGDWKGFIWHQGSLAAFSKKQYGEDRSLTYYGNLTGLVNEVRELMFQNSISWQCKEEIPVVVVQVGYWPRPQYNGDVRRAARRTRDAQARFCDEDPRAVLVKTDDLARFYHYDAPSFLISGNRIAHAYQEALRGVVECPDRVPSSSPSESIEPSFSPTEPPSSQPSTSPSSKPSSIPTTSPSVAESQHPSAVPSASPSMQPTSMPSSSPSSSPSAAPSHSPSASPSLYPSAIPSSMPTAPPSNVTLAVPSASRAVIPSVLSSGPSFPPTGSPSSQHSSSPLSLSEPSPIPTPSPLEAHGKVPSASRIISPSALPTALPSISPSSEPSGSPRASNKPSALPSSQPSLVASAFPSSEPTVSPSSRTSGSPSSNPTVTASGVPSTSPSTPPSSSPSAAPSTSPSNRPSFEPSASPSKEPTGAPSTFPSSSPSAQPSLHPSTPPSTQPTVQPSTSPSSSPTAQPSASPSSHPTTQPSASPSSKPSAIPSALPTGRPSITPSASPTNRPSSSPSASTSEFPSSAPSSQFTTSPSGQPTVMPTVSAEPTRQQRSTLWRLQKEALKHTDVADSSQNHGLSGPIVLGAFAFAAVVVLGISLHRIKTRGSVQRQSSSRREVEGPRDRERKRNNEKKYVQGNARWL